MGPDDEQDAVVNDLGEVSTCNCGGVNLTVGAVTLHLQSDELEDFHALASAALELVGTEPRTAGQAEERSAARPRKLGRILH